MSLTKGVVTMKKLNPIASVLVYIMLFAAGLILSIMSLWGIKASAANDPWASEGPEEPVVLSDMEKELLRQNAGGEELSFDFLDGKSKKEQLEQLEEMKANLEKAKGATLAEGCFEWNMRPDWSMYQWALRDLTMLLEDAIGENTIEDYKGWFDTDSEYVKILVTDKRTTDYGSTQVAPLVVNGHLEQSTTYLHHVSGIPGEEVLHLYSVVQYWYRPTGSGVPRVPTGDEGPMVSSWEYPDDDVSLRFAKVLIEWTYDAFGGRISNMWSDVGLDMIGKQKMFTYADETSYAAMQRWYWKQVNGDFTKFFK